MNSITYNIETLKKQREDIFFSSHRILLIVNIDLNDKIVHVSFVEQHVAKTEWIGKNWIQLFSIENQEHIQQLHQRARTNAKQEFYECDFNCMPNEICHVNVRIVPSFQNDELVGLTAIMNDITESKNAILSYNKREEMLSKIEAEFRAAFNELLVGVVIHASDTQILYSNHEASRILGLSVEQMLGKVSIDEEWMFVYENMEPVAIDDYPVNKVLKTKESISNYKLGVRHNNQDPITWVNVNATPFMDANNRSVEKIIINFIDITEQKLAADALQKSEANWANIMNNIGDPVFVKDQNSALLIVNDSFCKLFGLSKSEIIGKSLAEDVSDEERIHFLQIDKEVITTGNDNITEEFLTVRGGETLTISTRKTRYIDSDGNKFIIGVIRDITHMKKAQLALIESQRLGAIGEMTSSIAHDFNNSLQAIYGNVELAIAESGISASTQKYLETIKKMVNDTANRVQLLQRFGGKKIVNNKVSQIDLNTLIEEVMLQSRPMWKEEVEKKGLSISIQTQLNPLTPIQGIDADLRAAFYNIIKNSVEAMPQGGSIHIQTQQQQNKILVCITDTGCGMSEEIRARIFQPFFTTKGYELGRGLGMSGVYSIIKEHNGEIYVKSTAPNVGTTIEMALRIDNPIGAETNIPSTEPLASTTATSKKQLRILWVDDNDSIRTNASLMLEMMGHIPQTASSGKHAMALLKNQTFDVVFTDIGMPEMNGWQLADHIFEQYKQSILVIVVSGWGAEINEEEAKSHHVHSVISKPFDMNQIESILNQIA